MEHVEEIDSRQSWLKSSIDSFCRAYSQRVELFDPLTLTRSSVERRTVRRNSIKGAVDTAASIITRNRPRIRAQVRGGDWRDHVQARKIEKLILGEFLHLDIHSRTFDMLLDCLKTGTGHLFVGFDRSRKGVFIERVLPGTLVVDELGVTADRLPVERFRIRMMRRDRLSALFPKHADEIMAENNRMAWSNRPIPSGMAVVVEAWRLSLGPKFPGTYVCVTDGILLRKRDWPYDWFPFVDLWWSNPTTGFYGQGVVEDVLPLQERLNQLDSRIGEIEDRFAFPTIIVDAGTEISRQQLADPTIGKIISCQGQRPDIIQGAVPLPALYQERANIEQRILEEVGLSQFSAHALKPAGLESAVAMREFDSIQSQRFVNNHATFDRAHVDLAWLMLSAYADGFDTVDPPEGLLDEIDWSSVDRAEARFSLELAPASIFSETPSARRQTVVELAQVGQLDKSEVLYLLDNPDLEHASTMVYADHEAAEKIISLLSLGEYVAPESFLDLEVVIPKVRQASVKAFVMGADEEILHGFRTWIAQARQLQTEIVEAQMPQAPSPDGGMPANGEMPATTPMQDQSASLVDPAQMSTPTF